MSRPFWYLLKVTQVSGESVSNRRYLKYKCSTPKVDFEPTYLCPKLYTSDLTLSSISKCHNFQSFGMISLLLSMPFSAYLLFATSHLRILEYTFQTARIKCQVQASTFIKPELKSWKCYPPSFYLPSWNQNLTVRCCTCLSEIGHVLQSTKYTKQNFPDLCPGTKVIASNSWKYLHSAELTCLEGDVWHECPYVQTIINHRSSGCRTSYHPETH